VIFLTQIAQMPQMNADSLIAPQPATKPSKEICGNQR